MQCANLHGFRDEAGGQERGPGVLSLCLGGSQEGHWRGQQAAHPPGEDRASRNEVLIGNETVMFRHEKTFVHATAVAIAFPDNESLTDLSHKLAEVREYCLERVGDQLRINLVLVDNFSEEVKPFVDLVKTAAACYGDGIILRSTNLEALEAGLRELQGKRPLIHAATPANADAVAALALKYDAPLVARAATLDELVALTTKLAKLGVKEIVLDLPTDNPAAALQYNTLIRRPRSKMLLSR